MDQTLAIAEAIMIAGFIASIAQEAFLSHLEGQQARIASIAVSLVIGIVATFRTGGFVLATGTNDPFAIGLSVLGSAGIALMASQAAFKVLVRPINSLPAAK
jgi:hypothetical protein